MNGYKYIPLDKSHIIPFFNDISFSTAWTLFLSLSYAVYSVNKQEKAVSFHPVLEQKQKKIIHS